MTTTVSVVDAKNHFSALLARAEAGEEIVIARHGRPVVSLVAVHGRANRTPGTGHGVIWVADDFDATTDDHIAEWYSSPVEPT